MQPNKDIKQISFKLKDIVVPKYSFIVPQEEKITVPDHPFTFEIKSGVFFNEEQKVCIIVLHTKTFFDPEKEKLICDLVTQTVFEIENFDEIIKKENDGLTAPDQIVKTFLSIAISTTRGIFMMKNSDNFLQKVFIPIVNPSDLFKNGKDEQK